MEDDQRRQLAEALLKVVAIAIGLGAVIAIALFVMVKALGLDEGPPAAHATSEPDTPLPTTALTSSGSPTPSEEPRTTATSKPARSKDKIRLTATPGKVGQGERINLTGTYPGADNVALEVQRQENGAWVSFAGVQAQVRVGTFATYVMTSRTGGMKFRVFDPTAEAASNAVAVTVG